MKIAIMTQPLGKNYGGIMQAWALQQVLKRMGHEPVTIDRQPDKKGVVYLAARLSYRTAMKAVGRRKAPINFERHLPTILQHTQSFIDQHISMSEPLYSTQQLREHFDRENYDAVIVGSDQTWRPKYSPNIYNYFLDFLEDKNILRIAYASSFGVDEWEYTEEQTKRCAELAKKFDAISVREDSGVKLCRKYLGVEATHVLDPTLLLDQKSYKHLVDERRLSAVTSGLYSYILDRSSEKNEILKILSRKLNAESFSAQAKGDFYNWTTSEISKYIMPSPENFISGFYNGSSVITDSFHGLVFSIIFQKPFYAVVNAKRGSSRFYSLLEIVGLSDRLISAGDLQDIENDDSSIDWKATLQKLNAMQSSSIVLLDRVIRSK